MLTNIHGFIGYSIVAVGGVAGEVDDFFFDDKTWGVAYLIVKTSGEPGAKRVLLPPTSFGRPDAIRNEFRVAWSRGQVMTCPVASPFSIEDDETHLHSTTEIVRHQIHTFDGRIGRIEEIIVDDSCWAIRYMTVAIEDEDRTRQILISPRWIKSIALADDKLYIDFAMEIEMTRTGSPDLTFPVRRMHAGL